MTVVPANVDFLASAAASAAKARQVRPVAPTPDPLDVATALKCMTVFQAKTLDEDLERLDDEANAAPLVAAARILHSTAQHRRSEGDAVEDGEVDELLLNAALAFAMHGNFPSASAVLSEIRQQFLSASPTYHMVALVCDPRRAVAESLRRYTQPVRAFLEPWKDALTLSAKSERLAAFKVALKQLLQTAMGGSIAERALALGARMAAHQARRLAVINLLEDAPEIPKWYVLNAVESGLATLLPPQRQLLVDRRIAKHRRNTLLTLPTSTGKTFVAEACMVAALRSDSLCVYVAPYVAVGEQVKVSLSEKVKGSVPVVSMFGGFKLESLHGVIAESELLVATPERFDAWLRAGEGLDRLRTVVFDEIHIVENGARGARVEGVIARLLLLGRTNPKLRIIGLSAVLTKPEGVREWLGVAEADLHQIGWRPTARRLAMCLSNGNMYWVHGNDALRPPQTRPNEAVSEVTRIKLPGPIKPAAFAPPNEKSSAQNVAAIAKDFLKRLGSPGLVACPRKVDTRLLARVLAEGANEAEDEKLVAAATKIVGRYPWLNALADHVRRGVAYHNASLPFEVRREIESLTRQRQLQVVCATTTLAEGADLPFRWTIVSHWLTGLRDDGTRMKSMTFRNIAGRCGRAGAFSEGDTVLFENLMGPPSRQRPSSDVRRLEEVMFSSAPLDSTVGRGWRETPEPAQQLLAAAFGSQLMACIGEHPEMDDIVNELVGSSYASRCGGTRTLRNVLNKTLDGILDDSAAGGAFAVANSPVQLTQVGKAANRSGFSPDSCRLMLEFLSRDSFDDGPSLYASLLRRFHGIPEQSSDALRKICLGGRHRNPVKDGDLEAVITNLLDGVDLREVFERLPSRLKSKAQPDSVEAQFEEFVSLVDSVVANFLPWLLRGLGSLADFGSLDAALTDWQEMARTIEYKLNERADPAQAQESDETL
jgi:helicase